MLGVGKNTLPLPSRLPQDPRKALGADAGTGTNGDMLRFWGETLLSQGNSRGGECPAWESRMWKEERV